MELLISLVILILATWFVIWLIRQLAFIPANVREIIIVVIAVIAIIVLLLLLFPSLGSLHLGR